MVVDFDIIDRYKSIKDKYVIRMDADDDDKPKNASGHHGNTRLPYGLAKSEGMNTSGMRPKEVWEMLEGKGYSAQEAYSAMREGKKASDIRSSVQAGKTHESTGWERSKSNPDAFLIPPNQEGTKSEMDKMSPGTVIDVPGVVTCKKDFNGGWSADWFNWSYGESKGDTLTTDQLLREMNDISKKSSVTYPKEEQKRPAANAGAQKPEEKSFESEVKKLTRIGKDQYQINKESKEYVDVTTFPDDTKIKVGNVEYSKKQGAWHTIADYNGQKIPIKIGDADFAAKLRTRDENATVTFPTAKSEAPKEQKPKARAAAASMKRNPAVVQRAKKVSDALQKRIADAKSSMAELKQNAGSSLAVKELQGVIDVSENLANIVGNMIYNNL